MTGKVEKTLGDMIQEALKRAAADKPEAAGQEDQGEQECGCMSCSGNTVRTRTITLKNLTISLAQGTAADGQDELYFAVIDSDGAEHGLTVKTDAAVEEFLVAMQEMFA